MSIIIEEITRLHERKAFDCGIVELNQFLQQQARQKAAKHISKTYVACYETAPTQVAGYYTLTGYSVTASSKHKVYKKYPHPLNAVKLARLAVDRAHQDQKIGQRLLIDAMYRTVLVAEQISAIGLYVDPMTTGIIPFYEQYGFLNATPDDPLHLEMWLPIESCIEVVESLLKNSSQ